MVARFTKIVIFCDCILDFERSGSMISLVNGPSTSRYKKNVKKLTILKMSIFIMRYDNDVKLLTNW